MTPGPDRIARLLLVGRREGGMVSFDEAARILGVAPDEVGRLVERLVEGELGVPPFLGDDVATLAVKGSWIEVEVPDELGAGWPIHAADAACMIAALRAVRGGLPPRLRGRCDDLVRRLTAAVDPEVRAEADARARALAWGVSDAVDADVVGVLAEASERREVVRLTVYNASRDAVQTRDVPALVVLQHAESWYLCAREPGDGRLRWWRVDRVVAAERTGLPHRAAPPRPTEVRRPKLFDPPEHPLEVQVRFAAGDVTRAARWFGDDPDVRPTPDGDVVRTLRTPTLPILLRRLLAFGPGWEVVGPADARATTAAWAARLRTPIA